MKKVAITGGIACGKSVILQKLMFSHYVIYSSDAIAHDVLRNEAKEEIINAFGSFILNDNNEIDRHILSNIVFNNASYLERLNKIVHPYVRKRIEEIIKANTHLEIIFFEIPLLFESHMEDMFDASINIYCDIDIQINRIVERDNKTPEEALKIITSQMGTYERNKRATYAIDNSGDIEETYSKIDKIISEILSKE